jgi:hypothetical protein
MISAALGMAIAIACGNSSKKTTDAPASGDGSSAIDAAIDSNLPLGDAPPGDAPAGSGSGVTCGNMTCTSTQVCCVSGTGTQSCVASGTCTGTSFACTGPSSCPNNENCCYVAGTGTMCQATTCAVAACGSNADCSGAQSMCCPVGTTGFSFCAAHCP